jgi:hypothetical protein
MLLACHQRAELLLLPPPPLAPTGAQLLSSSLSLCLLSVVGES